MNNHLLSKQYINLKLVNILLLKPQFTEFILAGGYENRDFWNPSVGVGKRKRILNFLYIGKIYHNSILKQFKIKKKFLMAFFSLKIQYVIFPFGKHISLLNLLEKYFFIY